MRLVKVALGEKSETRRDSILKYAAEQGRNAMPILGWQLSLSPIIQRHMDGGVALKQLLKAGYI